MRILCLLLMLYSSAFGSSMLPTSDHVIEPDRYQKYSLKVVGSNLNTFGYEIYADNKLFIRQLTVPGIPGNKGFRRRRDAEK